MAKEAPAFMTYGKPPPPPPPSKFKIAGWTQEKDDALRYVEGELLGMRSLFDGKEAAIRAQMDVEAGRHASEMAQAKLQQS